ncbi:MAG: hypothetical protein HC854_14550 [Flavobacterium sp.]|nr:hypothetical protein [Flavobacterium sp.]
MGIEETKSSIDSKISRGSFSAAFFLQCLTVIGCEKIEIEEYESQLAIAAEPQVEFNKKNNKIQKVKFIDLFAGLGGIRLGFEKSFQDLGFETECVMTSEIKPYAVETLSAPQSLLTLS